MANMKRNRGATGATVAARLREIRTQQNLTYAAVAARLDAVGHPTQPLAIRRMEEGERAVDVDDLSAFAVVFGIAPVTLLLPDTNGVRDPVQITGECEPVEALTAHAWLRGVTALDFGRRHFATWANPEWLYLFAYADTDTGARLEYVTRGFDRHYLQFNEEEE